MYTHRIIHVGASTAPSELRFESEDAAWKWLEAYLVSASYKAENYRVVPISQKTATQEPADPLLLTVEGYRRGQIETLEAKCDCGAHLYGIVRVHHCNEAKPDAA